MSATISTTDGTRTVMLIQGAWIDGIGWAGVIAPVRVDEAAAMTPPTAASPPSPAMSDTFGELRRVLGAIAEHLGAPKTYVTTPGVVPAMLPAAPEPEEDPTPPAAPLDLSGREVDVLRLVAEGFTNVQIAERLFISPKTVSTHLMNIFSKLGVTTRAGATRAAIEHGLA